MGMAAASPSRILWCADRTPAGDDLGQVLEQAGHVVSRLVLNGAEPDDLATYNLIVFEGSRSQWEIIQACRRLRARLGDCFVPILFVTADPAPSVRLAGFEGGADTFLLRPCAPGELLAQVQAFLRIKGLHDRVAEKTVEVNRINKRLQQAYQQIDHELELARRIQQSFLPQALPDVPGARFAVHYRPCGRVGGDFYDLFRLDEQHVGMYVADAMGHGVPASLLTIFLKNGVRAKEISGKQYRLVPPNEVLQRLNHDLLAQELSESPFITMVYVLLNWRNGTLQFGRAGHPYPLYVPRDGQPEFWQVEGTLLGVFETQYTVQARELRPGDKVLLYTDGADTAPPNEEQAGRDTLLACAARHRALPIQAFVDRLSQDLLAQVQQPDDLTLLGVEMKAEGI
jgi:sigma-B regulation protein RsbU (phosphoserine phosphatase)